VNRLILAVDTTHEHGSLALLRGDQLLEEVALHAPTGFAHVLYRHLAELLDRHGVKPGDIDCFAAASGPGSFTGVRVGLSCIKGLAEAVGKPAVGISNLQAIATFGTGGLRAATLDARRGEIYGAVYSADCRLVSTETVAPLDKWLAALPPGDLEFLSPDDLPIPNLRRVPRELAAAVARLAARSDPQDPAAIDANYVRRSDAELLWRDVTSPDPRSQSGSSNG